MSDRAQTKRDIRRKAFEASVELLSSPCEDTSPPGALTLRRGWEAHEAPSLQQPQRALKTTETVYVFARSSRCRRHFHVPPTVGAFQ
jgi:hypothetical protein